MRSEADLAQRGGRPSWWVVSLLLVLLLVLLLGSPVWAQGFFQSDEGTGEEAPFDITADTVEFDTARKVYVARGHVRLEQPGRVLTADWMVFSDATRQGVASGDVVVTEGEDRLYADVLHFEVDELQGIVFDGRLEMGGNEFVATGDTIKRVGEQQYVFEDAEFTTCRCPDKEDRKPWSIRAREADLEFGDYAVTKSTTLDVLGVPVLWSPRMWWPLQTERKTGFLFPTFNASARNGFDVGLPFFWAARENINVLFTPHYLVDNGFKPELEVDYVFGPRSYGDFFGTWLRDQNIDPEDISTPFNQDRWAVEWVHDQELPLGWRWKTEARLLSDNSYAFDFRDLRRLRNDRYVESVSFLEKRFGPLGRYGFSGAVHYAEDQQNPDNLDRDAFLLQRLPDLRLSGLPTPVPGAPELPGLLGKASYSFDTRYTYFGARSDVADELPFATLVDGIFADTGIDAIPDGDERDRRGRRVLPDGTIVLRDGTTTTAAAILAANLDPTVDPLTLLPSPDGSSDDFPGPEGDGRFQEGEPLLDRGHRVVLNPRVAFPMRLADAVEVYPELGWHGTFYQTDEQGSEVRNLFTALLDVRARLRRELQLPGWLHGGDRALHVVEPRFTYTGVVAPSQSGNPLFVPRPLVLQERLRLLEPTSMVRDPSDRIDDVQAITLSLGNRFYVPGVVREDVIGPSRLLADIVVALHHDFSNSELTSLYLDGVARPWEGVRTRFNLGFDLDDPELQEALFTIGYGSPTGNDLRVSYRLVREVPRFFENFRFDEERFEDFEEGFVEINQLDLLARLAVTRNWAFTYRIRYSFEQTLALTNQIGVEYVSRCRCWAFRAELEDNRNRGFDFNFRYRILGLGDDTVRPFSRRKRGEQDSLIDEPVLN